MQCVLHKSNYVQCAQIDTEYVQCAHSVFTSSCVQCALLRQRDYVQCAFSYFCVFQVCDFPSCVHSSRQSSVVLQSLDSHVDGGCDIE